MLSMDSVILDNVHSPLIRSKGVNPNGLCYLAIIVPGLDYQGACTLFCVRIIVNSHLTQNLL